VVFVSQITALGAAMNCARETEEGRGRRGEDYCIYMPESRNRGRRRDNAGAQ
jgi:hypothetical protein